MEPERIKVVIIITFCFDLVVVCVRGVLIKTTADWRELGKLNAYHPYVEIIKPDNSAKTIYFSVFSCLVNFELSIMSV